MDTSDDEMVDAYLGFFHPRKEFLHALEFLHELDFGIFIRRGDILKFFSEARQTADQIIAWMSQKISGHGVMFSDDEAFVEFIKDFLPETITFYDCTNLTKSVGLSEPWQKEFIQFLILSYKCQKIYGTPCDTFTEQAGLFRGRKHYAKILS